MYVTITNQHLKYYEFLFADIFYNHGCKCIEFEALTLTDASTVMHMFVTVTDKAHGYPT